MGESAGNFAKIKQVANALAVFALSTCIFLIDYLIDISSAVSVLYILVLILAAISRRRNLVYTWTAICLTLASISFALTHAEDLDYEIALRFIFSITAIVITSTLLISRLNLQEARAAQKKSEAYLREFSNMAPQVLWRADAAGNVTYFNERFVELTGMSIEHALTARNWIRVFHPDDAEQFTELKARPQDSELGRRVHVRMRTADGVYRWMLISWRPLCSRDTGELTGWIGSASDVDAEIRAQQEIRHLNDTLERKVEERTAELARSELRFRTLFEDLNIAFAEQDIRTAKAMLDDLKAQGVTDFRAYADAHPEFVDRCIATIQVVNVNDALSQLMGYHNRLELIANPPMANAENAKAVLTLQLEAIFENRRQFSGQTVLIGKDNRRVPVVFGVNVPADWTTSLSTHIDVSEQKRAQELMLAAQDDLARASRAATIGALSTSLAHELNQPISAMVIDVQTCMRWLTKEKPHIEKAHLILERLARNAERVSGIIRKTRDQLVKRKRSATPTNLRELIDETHTLLEREVTARGASLQVTCKLELPLVLIDPIELQQVFVNLILNAADAMSSVQQDKRLISILIECASEDTIDVTVEDSGPGIPQSDIEQVFEPFFTTKPTGIGMGLQICRSIIEGAGGSLRVRNKGSGGAAFHFDLPAAPSLYSDVNDVIP